MDAKHCVRARYEQSREHRKKELVLVCHTLPQQLQFSEESYKVEMVVSQSHFKRFWEILGPLLCLRAVCTQFIPKINFFCLGISRHHRQRRQGLACSIYCLERWTPPTRGHHSGWQKYLCFTGVVHKPQKAAWLEVWHAPISTAY